MNDRNPRARLAPLQVHPALLASARRLAKAENRCCAKIVIATDLAKKWAGVK